MEPNQTSEPANPRARFHIRLFRSSPNLTEEQRQRLLTMIFARRVTLISPETQGKTPEIARRDVELPCDPAQRELQVRKLIEEYSKFRSENGKEHVSLDTERKNYASASHYYVYKGRRYCSVKAPVKKGENSPWIERAEFTNEDEELKFVEAEIYFAVESDLAAGEDLECDVEGNLEQAELDFQDLNYSSLAPQDRLSHPSTFSLSHADSEVVADSVPAATVSGELQTPSGSDEYQNGRWDSLDEQGTESQNGDCSQEQFPDGFESHGTNGDLDELNGKFLAPPCKVVVRIDRRGHPVVTLETFDASERKKRTLSFDPQRR